MNKLKSVYNKLFTHSIDSNNKESKATINEKESNEWECSLCTFLQPITNKTCEICNQMNPNCIPLPSENTHSTYNELNNVESKQTDDPLSNDPLGKVTLILIPHAQMALISECSIESCLHLAFLVEKMKVYDHYQINTTAIVSAFQHLLHRHSRDDSDFNYIFIAFGGECVLSQCSVMKRQYTERKESDDSILQEIMDRIHCHFQHSYHICRLTMDERMILENEYDDTDIATKSITAETLRKTNTFLNQKRANFTNTVPSNRFNRRSNKYTSNIELIEGSKTTTENEQIMSYSYSFNFHYWGIGIDQSVQHADGVNGGFTSVRAKYESLKQELLQNEVLMKHNKVLSKQKYETYWIFAQVYLDSTYCRRHCIANTDYASMNRRFCFHPSRFGYNNGDCIQIQHILCILIYCDFDDVQRIYSSSYRAKNKGLSLQDIAHEIGKEHSHFYHLAKGLRETVEVFGKLHHERNAIQKVSLYHGINQEMVFSGMQSSVYSPLSTTSSYSAASIFATNSGLILELIPYLEVKSFDCSMFSRFSWEEEIFFIGGSDLLNFVNITSIPEASHFKLYITAIRVIDVMTNGLFFDYDAAVIQRIQTKCTRNVSKLFNKKHFKQEIPQLQYLTKKLVEHALSKHFPAKFSKYESLHPYIEKLLHQICTHKNRIEIDCETFNNDVLETVDPLSEGYIGYRFLSQYFCTKLTGNYIEFNFEVIANLFPWSRTIVLQNVPAINDVFIECIFGFLSKSHHDLTKRIRSISMYIPKQSDEWIGDETLPIIKNNWRNPFAVIGCNLSAIISSKDCPNNVIGLDIYQSQFTCTNINTTDRESGNFLRFCSNKPYMMNVHCFE